LPFRDRWINSTAMSELGPEWRSYLPIEQTDLRRLLHIARTDMEDFFARYPHRGTLYRSRLLGFALCQGAANHFIGRPDGIQDFDVYAFFADLPGAHWYAKRVAVRDYGDPKFGRSASKPEFIGRRVDLLGRGLQCEPDTDIAKAVQHWLRTSSAKSVPLIAEKAVVLLSPEKRMGEVAWPLDAHEVGSGA
jgi:hypothetical protein